MRPGPVPVPSAKRAVRNPRYKPPLDEPQPRPAVPRCPAHVRIDQRSYRAWRRYTELLSRMKVLTEADEDVVGDLSVAQGCYLRCWGAVHRFNSVGGEEGVGGMIIRTKSDYLAEHMLFSQMKALLLIKNRLRGEVGLSPSSRTRVKTTDSAAVDSSEWAKFNRTSAAR